MSKRVGYSVSDETKLDTVEMLLLTVITNDFDVRWIVVHVFTVTASAFTNVGLLFTTEFTNHSFLQLVVGVGIEPTGKSNQDQKRL